MSKISKNNLEKIKSNILRVIYDEAPSGVSARKISEVEARDKQFILRLLKEMEKQKIVKNVRKEFSRKSYWTMTNAAYNKYKELL
tara:strand:+ start:332 stop:586 length:255 start_codon:yes stop_codon:yes gene_type:complete